MNLFETSSIALILAISTGLCYCGVCFDVTELAPSEAAAKLRDILFPYLRDCCHCPDSVKTRPICQALRRSKTTRNVAAWVEVAPGTFKSDPVVDEDQHNKHLYTLLAIKKKREEAKQQKGKNNLIK